LDSEQAQDSVTAEDIAAECERRAAIHRAEADKLEKTAGLIRGVLALPDSEV
jgi:regulator of protease activity HflC (stomatin/prohibitin superfamily)